MRLVQCVASQSGLFRNKKIDFSNQITVLYGPNDSGKTFLAQALIDLAVTTFCPAQEKSVIDWEKTHIDLTLQNGDTQITCSRTGNQTASLETAEDGISRTCSFAPGEAGTEFIQSALPSAGNYLSLLQRFGTDGFRECCFAASPLDEGNTINPEVLRRIFMEDSSQFHRLRSIMKRVFPDQGTGSAGLMAQIAGHENEVRLIEKQIQLSHIQKERRLKLEDETGLTRQDIEDCSGRLKELQESLDDARAVLDINREIGSIERAKEETEQNRSFEQEKIRAAAVVRTTLEKVFPQFVRFSELQKDNLTLIQTAYRTIRDAHENLTMIGENKKRIREKAFFRSAAASVFMSVCAAALLLIPGIRHFHHASAVIIGSATAAEAFILLAVFLSFRIATSKIPEEDARQALSESESRMKEILIQNGIAINGLNADDIYEFLLQYFEEYGFFSQQESDVMTLENELKTPDFFSQTELELKELDEKKKMLFENAQEKISRLKGRIQESGSEEEISALISSLEAESAAAEKEIQKKTELLSRIDEELLVESSDREENDAFGEQLAFHRGKLVVLCRKNRLARYILSLMDESAARREEMLFQRLSKETADIFHMLTSKQYATTINAQGILSFIMGDSAAVYNAQIAHLIVLSAKLALTDYLCEEKTDLPLFIDEPAVFMDSVRIKNFIEIVRTCSRKRQIVILTHDKNLCDGADTIVEL